MLAGTDLDWMQSMSMEFGVQRQTELNPITILFAGINDHLHNRGLLSRLREPVTVEPAVWPAIKEVPESMGGPVERRQVPEVTPKPVFVLSPGYAHLPDGLKIVSAMIALLSEGKYDVIITAPNCEVEARNLRSLRPELPAVWSDISNAMRGLKDLSLQMLVLDGLLALEFPDFDRKLKLKP